MLRQNKSIVCQLWIIPIFNFSIEHWSADDHYKHYKVTLTSWAGRLVLQAPVTRKAKTQFLLKLSPIGSFRLKGFSLLETFLATVTILLMLLLLLLTDEPYHKIMTWVIVQWSNVLNAQRFTKWQAQQVCQLVLSFFPVCAYSWPKRHFYANFKRSGLILGVCLPIFHVFCAYFSDTKSMLVLIFTAFACLPRVV